MNKVMLTALSAVLCVSLVRSEEQERPSMFELICQNVPAASKCAKEDLSFLKKYCDACERICREANDALHEENSSNPEGYNLFKEIFQIDEVVMLIND